MIPVLIPPHPRQGLPPDDVGAWVVTWVADEYIVRCFMKDEGLEVVGWSNGEKLGREATHALVRKLWPRMADGTPLALQERVYYVTKYHH